MANVFYTIRNIDRNQSFTITKNSVAYIKTPSINTLDECCKYLFYH